MGIHAFIQNTLTHGPEHCKSGPVSGTTLQPGLPVGDNIATRLVSLTSFRLLDSEGSPTRIMPSAALHLCEMEDDSTSDDNKDRHFLALAFAYQPSGVARGYKNAYLRLEGQSLLNTCMTYSSIRRCYTHGSEKGLKHDEVLCLVALSSTLHDSEMDLQPTSELKKRKLSGGLCYEAKCNAEGSKEPRKLAGVYILFVAPPAFKEGSREESILNELAWPHNGHYWTKAFVEEWCAKHKGSEERKAVIEGVLGIARTNVKESFFDPAPICTQEATGEDESSGGETSDRPPTSRRPVTTAPSASLTQAPPRFSTKQKSSRRPKSRFVLDECEVGSESEEESLGSSEAESEDDAASRSTSRSSTDTSMSGEEGGVVDASNSESEASRSGTSTSQQPGKRQRRIEDSVSDLESNESCSDDEGPRAPPKKVACTTSPTRARPVARASPTAGTDAALPTALDVKHAVEGDASYTTKMPTKSARWLLEKLYQSATLSVETRLAGMHASDAEPIRKAVACLDSLYNESLQDGRRLGPETAAEKEAHLLTLVDCLARAPFGEAKTPPPPLPPSLARSTALCEAFSSSVQSMLPALQHFQTALDEAGAAARASETRIYAARDAMRLAQEMTCLPDAAPVAPVVAAVAQEEEPPALEEACPITQEEEVVAPASETAKDLPRSTFMEREASSKAASAVSYVAKALEIVVLQEKKGREGRAAEAAAEGKEPTPEPFEFYVAKEALAQHVHTACTEMKVNTVVVNTAIKDLKKCFPLETKVLETGASKPGDKEKLNWTKVHYERALAALKAQGLCAEEEEREGGDTSRLDAQGVDCAKASADLVTGVGPSPHNWRSTIGLLYDPDVDLEVEADTRPDF